MADEATIAPDMVVRLLGNADAYFKMMTEAAERTKAEADRIREQADSIGRSFSVQAVKGLNALSGAMGTTLGVVTVSAKLAKQQFNSIGEGMAMLGGLAATVGGPVGAAFGAVLTVGGQLIDFFERGLLKSQAIARQGFMSVAEGAQTAQGAMLSVARGGMQRGLEQVVNVLQQEEQGRFGRAVSHLFSGRIFEQGFTYDTTSRALERQVSLATRAQNEMRQLLTSGPNTVVGAARLDLGAQEMNQELLLRSQTSGQMRLQRDLMRAMAQGDRTRINALQEEVAIRKYIRQFMTGPNGQIIGGMSDEQARNYARGRIDPSILRQVQEQSVQDVEHRHQTQLADREVTSRQELRHLAGEQYILEQKLSGASEYRVKQLEAELKMEMELHKMQEQGFSPLQLSLRRVTLGSMSELQMQNYLLQQGIRVTDQVRTSEEKYGDELERLQLLLQQGAISFETFTRAEERAWRQRDQAREWNSVVREGVQLVEEMTGGQGQRIWEQQNAVVQAFIAGQVSAEDYAIAIDRLNSRYEALDRTLSSVEQAGYRTSEAVRRYEDQIERFRASPISLPEQAGPRVIGGGGYSAVMPGQTLGGTRGWQNRVVTLLERIAEASEAGENEGEEEGGQGDFWDWFAPANLGGGG